MAIEVTRYTASKRNAAAAARDAIPGSPTHRWLSEVARDGNRYGGRSPLFIARESGRVTGYLTGYVHDNEFTVIGLYGRGRGSSDGSALMRAAAQYAVDTKRTAYWSASPGVFQVQGAVAPARPFYAAVGGDVSDRHSGVRYDTAATRALAAGRPLDKRGAQAWLPEGERRAAGTRAAASTSNS